MVYTVAFGIAHCTCSLLPSISRLVVNGKYAISINKPDVHICTSRIITIIHKIWILAAGECRLIFRIRLPMTTE